MLNIPRGTYYQSKHQTESKWKLENQQLLERIKKIYFESSRRYGAINYLTPEECEQLARQIA